MDGTGLVGVGASAGGVEALLELVEGLAADLPLALLVVLHQAPTAPTVLPDILDRRCALDVVAARDGDPLRAGRVLVAPPDRHLHVDDGHVRLSPDPRGSPHRPSVDVLFHSLAVAAGPLATGVVLSGMLDDGAVGLAEIVDHGGTALVQDPDDALHPGMPRAALGRVPDALVVRPAMIGAALAEMAATAPRPEDDVDGGSRTR
ncbi:chemotaxis protein CheB [Actinomycetospora atypica]|uniref:protein-glutamate methylesterase n=1 Tax=Actinomycetospora atypica TaxID=1290095 RepID=A0ABV9YET3_9PSEU